MRGKRATALVLAIGAAAFGVACEPEGDGWVLPNGTWRVSMDFEEGPDGAVAVGPDAFDATPMDAPVTRLRRGMSFSGARSAELSVRAGDDLFGGMKNFPTRLGPGSQVWIRFRVYWPDGFDFTASPYLKFFRVHTRSPGVENEGYLDVYINNPDRGTHPPFQFIKEFDDRWFLFGRNPTHDPRRGVWETYEVHYVFDTLAASRGGRARARMWKNGELIGDVADVPTLRRGDSYAHSFQYSYWNGGAPRTQSWYIDDVVMTSATPPARDAAGNPMIGLAWEAMPR